MITLATGSLVGYAYAMEFFIAWYGANSYEGFAFINRAFGNYWWSYWISGFLQCYLSAVVLVQKDSSKHDLLFGLFPSS